MGTPIDCPAPKPLPLLKKDSEGEAYALWKGSATSSRGSPWPRGASQLNLGRPILKRRSLQDSTGSPPSRIHDIGTWFQIGKTTEGLVLAELYFGTR